jgi:hypothetical protein
VKVFVSSTFRDLAEHREVLRLALETSGHQFRGMEHFPAQQAPPLEVALAALEHSDVYVGIIGDLYGSCPPGRVLSYTELEYNRATELDMYRIILILGDDAHVNRMHIERDPNRLRRLLRFRGRILENHTVQKFRDIHEAAWKILAALRNYELRLSEEQQ